ncbi:MAG: hypothetical protein JET69_04015 [Methanomassiliicoccales archaeon]|nr:hypothetical protein [Methanomassiliicoccales archaeon]
MATIIVSAAALILSLPRTNGPQAVSNYPVNISLTSPSDYHTSYTDTTGMEAWGYTSTVPGKSYGEEFSAAYVGGATPYYDIKVTVISNVTFDANDITIGYIKNGNAPDVSTPETGATYTALNIAAANQVDTDIWSSSVVIHSSAGTQMYYWMQITPYLENSSFTVTYQAVESAAK